MIWIIDHLMQSPTFNIVGFGIYDGKNILLDKATHSIRVGIESAQKPHKVNI